MSYFWGSSAPAAPFDPVADMITYGRLGHLTPEQEEKLAQFKKEITDEGIYNEQRHSDHLLLRFLRARKFDLAASKLMFTNYVTWRKEKGIDEIIDSWDLPQWAQVREIYPRFYHQVDKCGRPIYIEQLGKLDIAKLFSVITLEEMSRNHVYEYERLINYRLPSCSEKANRPLEQSFSIIDLKGVSLSQFYSAFNVVKEASSVAQDYYPEMLGKMFIINAPTLFSGLWVMVKPYLDEATVKKISILGGPQYYLPELKKYVDEDKIPSTMGGTCNCEGGCENSDLGPWSDGSVPGFPQDRYERLRNKYFLKKQ